MRFTQRITLLYTFEAPSEDEAFEEAQERAHAIGSKVNESSKQEILFTGETENDGGKLYDAVAGESPVAEPVGSNVIPFRLSDPKLP